MLRLYVDSSPLFVNSAGVKTYLFHWIRALQRTAGHHQLSSLPPGGLSVLKHYRKPPATYPGVAMIVAMNYSGLPVAEWFTRRADIFHVSNLLRRVPRRSRITATIHDMTAWLAPEAHTKRNVGNDLRFAKEVLKNAHGLIAVSNATKQDAIRLLGLDSDRVRVIHSGVADSYFDVDLSAIAGAREKLDLRKPYCLFVGTVEPRKNLDRLLDAWAALGKDFRESFDLVLAGMPGWNSKERLARLRASTPGIKYLGYVPESLMPGLTAGAVALVMPSLYEGFGLPLAQAMAAGVPVITSNLSSMPEIAGDCGLLVDPLSVHDLSQSLKKLLQDPDLRQELGRRGRIRADRFRWERTAHQSWEFFEQVLG